MQHFPDPVELERKWREFSRALAKIAKSLRAAAIVFEQAAKQQRRPRRRPSR